MIEFEKNLDIIIKSKMDYIEELKNKRTKLEEREKQAIDLNIKKSINLSLKKLNYSINDVLNEIIFCRIPTQEDVDYRINQITSKDFLREMYSAFPKDLPLRFHGSPIHRVKQIIESGVISSSVDRVGFETSTNNLSNQISSYDISLFSTSIINYINITDIYVPLGCLFVLIDADNSNISQNGLCTMSNINIKDNANLLFAIITSPESSIIVKDWCNRHEIDSNKVFDFYEFVEHMKQSKKYKNG
jgi:hypothetical protein